MNYTRVVQNSEFIDCYGNSFQFMSVNLNWNDKKRISQNYNLKKFNACDAFWEINLQTSRLFLTLARPVFFIISEVNAKRITKNIYNNGIYIVYIKFFLT